MDRNTIIGFVLIGLVLFTFTWLSRPSQEEIAQKRAQDSIALVEYNKIQAEMLLAEQQQKIISDSLAVAAEPDSLKDQQLFNVYGAFAAAASGKDTVVSLENELLSLTFSSKGGQLLSATLKEYTAYDSLPLMLFDKEEARFGLTLTTLNNRVVNTEDLYFEPISEGGNRLTMRLHAGENIYLDYVYSLQPNDYMLDFKVTSKGLDQVLSGNLTSVDLQWIQKVRQQELGRKYEDQRTQLFYKYSADNVEELNAGKEEVKNIPNRLKWIAYKDQYFSTVLISGQDFESSSLETKIFKTGRYTKEFKTSAVVPFDTKGIEPTTFTYYLGPNKYKLLKEYDKTKYEGQDMQLEKLVPLGWSLFRYVNQWIIIPIFDFLVNIFGNLGLSIFLLTLIIKLALFPLTYKSLISSAKMRVLKPQVEEINEKYPGQDNALTRQQKTMELYKKAGASPMSGCMPMLLQMPFLIALFMFFPSAIELRHESFLWAKDLSTYDAIISWNTYIPLVTPYFGNHISLFCLLMTVCNIIYTKFNMEQTNTGQQQMPGMKMMMYLMPLMMLVFLNQFPAGLNYYYFISTLITIVQTIAFRYFLNEEKLLLRLEQNKKKPVKKSGFMARLEEAQRRQLELQKQQQKKAAGKGGSRK